MAPARAAHRPVVAPLAPERYRLQCTLDKEAENDLRRLQDLLRREIPDGDPGVIIARALSVLRKAVEKEKLAETPKPRPGREAKPGTRYVPARVRRAVWRRDGGRCAFVARDGKRCAERSYIELHHAERPFAKGGKQTVENMSLRCRVHNAYESELIFGPYDPARVRETAAGYDCSSGRLPVPERVGVRAARANSRDAATSPPD